MAPIRTLLLIVLTTQFVAGCITIEGIRSSAPIHETLLQGAPRDIAFCVREKTEGDSQLRHWENGDSSIVKFQSALFIDQDNVVPLWEATLTKDGSQTLFEMRAAEDIWGGHVGGAEDAISLFRSCG